MSTICSEYVCKKGITCLALREINDENILNFSLVLNWTTLNILLEMEL